MVTDFIQQRTHEAVQFLKTSFVKQHIEDRTKIEAQQVLLKVLRV